MPVEAILFDFGGTLDSDGTAWKDRFYPLYLKAGLPLERETFDRCFYASDDFLTERNLKTTPYRRTLELQVSGVLKRAGFFRKDRVKKIAGKFLSDSLRNLRRNLPLLRRLKRRYRLGIVSNF